jgi:hypothetical protein
MADTARRHGVAQRAGDVFLPDDIVESSRSPFAVEGL